MTAPAELLQGWPGLHHTHQFNRLVVLHQGRKSKYMQKSSSKGFHSKTSSVNNFDELLLLLPFISLIIVHDRCMMAILRSCCLCFSTRTGSFVLGTVGIILGATLLAPMAVFLDYHSYYITQFVASERVGGNYIDDDQVNFFVTKYVFTQTLTYMYAQVPKMEFFSKMLFTALLALDVIFVLSCVLLLAGIAGTR